MTTPTRSLLFLQEREDSFQLVLMLKVSFAPIVTTVQELIIFTQGAGLDSKEEYANPAEKKLAYLTRFVGGMLFLLCPPSMSSIP
jgi:hypothetical protein